MWKKIDISSKPIHKGFYIFSMLIISTSMLSKLPSIFTETETETWVVSISGLRLETTLLKFESQSQSLRPLIKSLGISLRV